MGGANAKIQQDETLITQTFNALGLHQINAAVFGAGWHKQGGQQLVSVNPSTGKPLAVVKCLQGEDAQQAYNHMVNDAQKAFTKWRMVPAPVRGEMIRQLGDELRKHKEDLGRLVSLEVGKIYSEGLGEVQEAIDICDFAVGLSRQLYGLSMHSERPGHRMYEQWHPLGPIGIITAFNFPCAVWAWNAAVAAVCGNTMIWKPSEKAPLTALALHTIAERVFKKNGHEGVMNLFVHPDKTIGEAMAADTRLPLVSATGSVPMGRSVAQTVAARLGKSLLELGGNNAIIVMEDADIQLALRGIAFGAMGTAGQRCTTTRRVYVHESIANTLTEKLEQAYQQIPIGDPLTPKTLMGPLIDKAAVDTMQQALKKAQAQGGNLVYGGKPLEMGGGYFVEPALVTCPHPIDMMQEEVFAPILYVCPVSGYEEAIGLQNNVPQGLSSAIFTESFRTAERFLSHAGSDCGIANVNIGTSGAEIGGAFGGEKETGGGRESGSDAWKAYMRRQTCTLNWSGELPLAQGVQFL